MHPHAPEWPSQKWRETNAENGANITAGCVGYDGMLQAERCFVDEAEDLGGGAGWKKWKKKKKKKR